MRLVSKYGRSRRTVRFLVWLSWPLMRLAKKWSAVPVLKWIINPFFKRPYNEVTSIPINVELKPQSVPLPRRLVERLVSEVDEKFILHGCICREHDGVTTPPPDIGCIALGPAIEVVALHTVMTIFPLAFPAPRYLRASGTSLNS